MKLKNLILAGGVVCFYVAAFATAGPAKVFEFPATKWVTQNPPTSTELAGHVFVIEFWATWCPPCREQIPHMKSLARKYEDRNVVFIGLSEDQSISDVRKFVEKKNINYHIGMDSGLSDRLGINGIPTALIVSHEGKILWNGHPADARFETTLESAVSAAPKPMLTGVDMGRFSHLRIKLCGGRNFADAYAEVQAYAQKTDSSDRIVADKIINTINEKLRQKIEAAHQVRNSNPQTAMLMYKDIIDSYGGINLTKEVESVYRQLQQEVATEMQTAVPAQARAGI